MKKLFFLFVVTKTTFTFCQCPADGYTKIVGGSGFDQAQSIWPSADGGYYVGGITGSFGAGGLDFFLAKFSDNDSIVWAKAVGTALNDDARFLMFLA
ncbi:MAG: hypothetical protein SH856_12005 [Flavobacteriales bacterium]|nr:hypothetical protein [Flavobacteriales bacterium]